MVQLQMLILTLIFNNLITYSDGKTCPKGQKVTRKSGSCEACPDGYYQPTENESTECKPCTRCDQNSGSVANKQCTKVSNTECKCQQNFSPVEDDSSTCKCPKGNGLNQGQCSPCLHGTFNTKENSPCRQWKRCKFGVKFSGNRSSDAICSDNNTALPSTPIEKSSTVAPSKPRHTSANSPHTTYSSTTRATATVVDKEDSSTETNIGLILSIFGLVIFLLLFCAVTWKLKHSKKVAIQPGMYQDYRFSLNKILQIVITLLLLIIVMF
ncbi:tumor necrosis factor receptor superfamily member 4 isoform X1 [Synchiropus splendidus]|uniref:tumor necrosis factor receptor superfamily member 4 isoform X1 n=1 Tax=Synchiropus splendidus TaxID=270530 RepID=UPI00237E5A82|nr:tumor necrosis factor receptor superfamily member 4 isoform X1 [Synchiropus splendidus]